MFKENGPSVPFLLLLYLGLGVDGLFTALVELGRTNSRIENFIQYAKVIPKSVFGAQRRCSSLRGVSVEVPHEEVEGATRMYFPPPHKETDGVEFSSLGFMNINSYGGGSISANDRARFADGRGDFFRQKKFVKNMLRRGLRFRTEKHEYANVHVPGDLPGLFFQYDGEARYMFNPKKARGLDFTIRRAMQIPVVLGPEASDEVQCDSDEEEEEAERSGREFRLLGDIREVNAFHKRVVRWATGQVAKDMNATPRDLEKLHERIVDVAKGICCRRQRVPADFGGVFASSNICSVCGAMIPNHGCQGCHKRFCSACLRNHMDSTPNFQWMYADAGLVGAVAQMNRFRWSGRLCFDDVIHELRDSAHERPIRLLTIVQDAETDRRDFESRTEAIDWLTSYRAKDSQDAGEECDGSLMHPYDDADDSEADITSAEHHTSAEFLNGGLAPQLAPGRPQHPTSTPPIMGYPAQPGVMPLQLQQQPVQLQQQPVRLQQQLVQLRPAGLHSPPPPPQRLAVPQRFVTGNNHPPIRYQHAMRQSPSAPTFQPWHGVSVAPSARVLAVVPPSGRRT